MKVLGAGLTTSANETLFSFTQGIDVDQRLYRQEIAAQKAWAQALQLANYLTANDCEALIGVLSKAQIEIEQKTFPWKIEDEDIHMNLERFMVEQLGDLGKKIHLGRSRNDLIATTLRLFLNDELQKTLDLTKSVVNAIYETSKKWQQILIPGMTHLQFGQPIRWSHVFSAHGHALLRDIHRLQYNQKECLASMPLGSAAFAGTHINIDLKALAQTLGFTTGPINSYDAVGDRDFILSTLNSYSLLAVHLSRLCEDVMYWSSSGVQLLQLPYNWSTGSSIMPNKRNPDIPELVRAKMARVIGQAQEGLMLVRSVTPSYGSDLHELKRTFLIAHDELLPCLNILVPFISELNVNESKAKELLEQGHILATDYANEMAKNQSFRTAYKQLAQDIVAANQHHQQIHHYYKESNPATSIDFETSVEARSNLGGTSLKTAAEALEKLKK